MAGRLLQELKVAELRKELEVRGKDKTGVKQVLLDRLKEVIHDEGYDPLSFRFGSEVEQKQDATVNEDADPEKGTCELSKGSTDACVTLPEVIEEPVNQKKIADEAVPYVVQVGDQEEDLDYDLKNDNTVQDPKGVQSDSQEADAHTTMLGDLPESVKDCSAADKLNEDRHCQTAEKRNLWVSNLPKTMKAADLKQHFSKAGKVVSATVVTRTRAPGGCFGFLQMSNAEEATNAANQLNGTEIDGFKITVEATERKPLSLPSKRLVHCINQPRTAYQPPIKRFGDRRGLAGRSFNQRRIIGRNYTNTMTRTILSRNFDQERSILGARRRIDDFSVPVRRIQRPRPGNLVHQYVKRAAHLLNLSRYGMKQNAQPSVFEQSIHRFRRDISRPNVHYSKLPYEYKRSVSGSTTSLRRFDDNSHLGDKRRFTLPTEERVRPVMLLPRRIEDMRINRNPPVRISRQNAPSEDYPTRGSHTSRDYDAYSRTVRNHSTAFENKRSVPTRPAPARLYDRDERLRMTSNGGARGGLSSRPPYRYKPSYPERPLEVRPSPGSRVYPAAKPALMSDIRREHRAVSRSPPRSRNTTSRPCAETPSDNRIFKHTSRDRSPLGYSGSGSSVRPKVVDYGHRSEPRGSWSSWKMEQDSRHISPPAGHTWKPAGQAYPVSNYPRGPYRYT